MLDQVEQPGCRLVAFERLEQLLRTAAARLEQDAGNCLVHARSDVVRAANTELPIDRTENSFALRRAQRESARRHRCGPRGSSAAGASTGTMLSPSRSTRGTSGLAWCAGTALKVSALPGTTSSTSSTHNRNRVFARSSTRRCSADSLGLGRPSR